MEDPRSPEPDGTGQASAAACWALTTAKDGVSALSLQRALEIGSYQTAWAMLHRLRSVLVLVRPGRDRLSGTVEVDETYFGGGEPGLRGGRQKGKKVLVAVAVELREPHGLGRCRMGALHEGSADSIVPFVTENVEEGTTVIADGWPSSGWMQSPNGRNGNRPCRYPVVRICT